MPFLLRAFLTDLRADPTLPVVARLLPLVHDLNFARTQRKLTASESKALVVATHVLQHARSVNAPMHRDERAFGIFSPIQKVHEVPVSELLASDEPLAEFLGVVKLMDDLWLKFMSPRSASDPLPGSYDFYRLNFEEFRSELVADGPSGRR